MSLLCPPLPTNNQHNFVPVKQPTCLPPSSHPSPSPSPPPDEARVRPRPNGSPKKQAWSRDEDELLVWLVKRHGPGNWSATAAHLQGRGGKQCRERWHNHLSPGISKQPWTEEEDRLIEKYVATIGKKWAQIAKAMPGRPDNAIKNRWHSHISKRKPGAAAAAVEAAAAAEVERKREREENDEELLELHRSTEQLSKMFAPPERKVAKLEPVLVVNHHPHPASHLQLLAEVSLASLAAC